MKSKKSFIIAAVLTTLLVVIAIFMFINGLYLSPYLGIKNVFITLGFTASGMVIWYLVHNFLHELFHLLFAKICGAKILEFGAIGLLIYTEDRKKKVRFDLKSGYAGRVGFVCNKPETSARTLLISLLGGLVGTVVTFGLIVVIHVLSRSYYSYYLVLMGVFIVLYMFVINYACDFPSSDGRMLFMATGGKKEFLRAAKILFTESMLYKGFTITASMPEKYDMITYYDVLYSLVVGDIRGAKLLIDILETDEKTGDNELIAAFYEKFFIACIESDKKVIQENEKRFSDISDDSAQALRTQMAYRTYTGEKDWVEILKRNYNKTLYKMPLKGLAITQQIIIDKYIK